MNIETLELIHKLLTEHVDNASRCRERARDKLEAARDDATGDYGRCKAKF